MLGINVPGPHPSASHRAASVAIALLSGGLSHEPAPRSGGEARKRCEFRQFARDRRTEEERERYWRDEDQYKSYRGPIKIGVITCEWDDEEVYQGFRHPDPTDPEPPRNLTEEHYEINLEWDAIKREWLKNWRDGAAPYGAVFVQGQPPPPEATAAWIGDGPAQTLSTWGYTVPTVLRRQWMEALRAEHEAARQEKLAQWRKDNIWGGGEWEPVGPRFHVDGPFPIG